MASASADNTCRIWISRPRSALSLMKTIKSFATGSSWSQQWIVVRISTKDKQAVIFDPRKEGNAMTAATHAREQDSRRYLG